MSEPQKMDAKASYWWCDNCREEIHGAHVTCSEMHEVCGHPVRGIDPVPLVDPQPQEHPHTALLRDACWVLERIVGARVLRGPSLIEDTNDIVNRITAAQPQEQETNRYDEWRAAIEDALGVESDRMNHTPDWARSLVRKIREIGNRQQQEELGQQAMLTVAGKPFRCECGGNVFAKAEPSTYTCNSCHAQYSSDDV